MNTHDLVAFVAVVETGSIVAASVRLNLTQPGVTRRIQNLEEMLGAELLDRVSKPLKPTQAGREAGQARVSGVSSEIGRRPAKPASCVCQKATLGSSNSQHRQ